VNHGGPNSTTRHVGDLGNIDAQADGTSEGTMQDSQIQLFGKHSIIGRVVRVFNNFTNNVRCFDINSSIEALFVKLF
jgi:Cu/Zn superoxide dismutase